MNNLIIAPSQYTDTAPRRKKTKELQLPLVGIVKDTIPSQWKRFKTRSTQSSYTITVPVEIKQESKAKMVIKKVIQELELMGFLEAIDGFVGEEGCNIIAVADVLSEEQRYKIWDIKWKFIERYPDVGIDIRLLQRRGRPMSSVFQASSSTSFPARQPAS